MPEGGMELMMCALRVGVLCEGLIGVSGLVPFRWASVKGIAQTANEQKHVRCALQQMSLYTFGKFVFHFHVLPRIYF